MSAVVTSESFELAKELLAEGKRDLLVYAIPDAVSNCSKACEIMVKVKGEMSTECAEAYFYYGKALLELSRVESGVLGNALDGVDIETNAIDAKDALVEDTEAMSTDEKSEIEEKVADALEQNFEKHDIVARAHMGDNIEEDIEDEDMEEDEVSDDMETDVQKADAEVGNLELAWQMFDLAKVIYSKAGDVSKECESLTFLGEVSLENSNYQQAVEDLTLCLDKRISVLPADSRSIAETHYQLGVALAQSGEYSKAEKSLEAAVSVLNTRMGNLRKMETSENISAELAELDLLCNEIKERSADHMEMQKGTYKDEKDFVAIFKEMMPGAEVQEISIKKVAVTA